MFPCFWSLAVQSLPQQRRDGVVPILLRIPQSRSAVVAHQSLVRARLEQQLDGSREVYIRRPCICDCWLMLLAVIMDSWW